MEKKREEIKTQIHSRDMPKVRRDDTDKIKVLKENKSILKDSVKDTVKGTVKDSVQMGVRSTLNQMEGSDEIENALITASVISRPVTGSAKKMGKSVREQAKRRHIKETQIKNVRDKKDTVKKAVHSRDESQSAGSIDKRKIHHNESYIKSDSSRKKVKSQGSNRNNKNSSGKSKSSRNRKTAYFLQKVMGNSGGLNSTENGETSKTGIGEVIKGAVINIGIIVLPFVLILLLIIAAVAALIAAVVAVIYNSPFSIFFPPLESGDTVMTVTSRYEAEFNREINDLINEHKGCDIGKIVYTDYEGTSATPSNYYDVMSVYMVNYGIGNTASVMDDKGMANLKNVFDDMCTYTTSTGEEKIETDSGKKEKKKVFYVNVTLKTYHQMETEYSMSDDEISLLNSLMSTESKEALGIPNGSGTQTGGNQKSSLSKEEINEILSKITDEKSKQAVSFALSKVGYPYSQPLRDSGTHFDCSSLAFYSWSEAGVNISYNGSYTAAGEAQWCSENKKTITEEELKPGDLIFFSYNNNGRYKNISHVGIYVGDGKMVEAVDEKTGVVIQDYHNKSLVMTGRPYKKK